MERIRLLFVCLGNICRSPAAEGVARVLGRDLPWLERVDSAGTGPWHVGEPPHLLMQKVAARRGFPIADLRARQVRVADFSDFHWIIAMDPSNLKNLQRMADSLATPPQARLRLLLDRPRHGTDAVPDPYYGGVEGFEESLLLVESGIRDLYRDIRP